MTKARTVLMVIAGYQMFFIQHDVDFDPEQTNKEPEAAIYIKRVDEELKKVQKGDGVATGINKHCKTGDHIHKKARYSEVMMRPGDILIMGSGRKNVHSSLKQDMWHGQNCTIIWYSPNDCTKLVPAAAKPCGCSACGSELD